MLETSNTTIKKTLIRKLSEDHIRNIIWDHMVESSKEFQETSPEDIVFNIEHDDDDRDIQILCSASLTIEDESEIDTLEVID